MEKLITNTITETLNLINANKSEWENRYNEYAELMLKNKDKITELKKTFNEHAPLHYYISTTQAKSYANVLTLDVRYRGQNVATLKVAQDKITISTKTASIESTNKRDFDCIIDLDDETWTSEKAGEFRSFFKNRPDIRNNGKKKNNEHHVESLLLSEFSKKTASIKEILHIQPVKYSGIRYAMPTPLKASNPNELKYAKQYGGGTDILARTGRGGATYLTVIEVKDENNPSEPPTTALMQAIRYAVFIRQLLRSSHGASWYKLFGFDSNLPEKLTIRVACAMPDDIEDKTFENKTYPIENDSIEYHYIYFKYNGQQLNAFQTSLPQ